MNMYNKSRDNEVIQMMEKLSRNPELMNRLKEILDEPKDKIKVSIKSKGKAKRPLTEVEYNSIISAIYSGFNYFEKGKERYFEPNKKVGLALIIEATTGLRVSDIVNLTVSNFNTVNGRIEIHEKKTNKLQYRKVNDNLINLVYKYAYSNQIDVNSKLIKCTERNIQIAVKKAADSLGYHNIGTHSFRKYFSMYVYNSTKDIQIVQKLLNHSSLVTTQRYLGVDQEKIDEVSSSVDFTNIIR